MRESEAVTGASGFNEFKKKRREPSKPTARPRSQAPSLLAVHNGAGRPKDQKGRRGKKGGLAQEKGDRFDAMVDKYKSKLSKASGWM